MHVAYFSNGLNSSALAHDQVPQRMEMNFEEVTRVCGADVPTQCADAFNSIPRFPRASAKLENPRRSFPPRMQLSSSAPTAAAEQMSIPEVARLRRQNEALLQENSRLQAMSDRMSHQLRLAHSKMEGSTPPHGEIGVELHRRELEATRTSLQFAQLQLEKDRVRLQKREGILKVGWRTACVG